MSRPLAVLLLTGALCAWGAAGNAQTARYAKANGNWNAAGTWFTNDCATPGGTNAVPVAGDIVTICAGFTVTLNVAPPTIRTITIQGTLNNNAVARTLTLTGTAVPTTLFTLDTGGTFNHGTFINVVMNPDNATATTLTGGTAGAITFNNLTLSPTITGARTYNFGSAPITLANLTVNPNAGAAQLLTVNMGAAITVAAAGTTSITRTGANATSLLDTTTGNHALSTGRINIAAGGTFTANDSTITLTAIAGAAALFTRAGTFNEGGSIVEVKTDTSRTLTSGTIAFRHLQLTPTITAARAYTFGAFATTILGDFLVNPTAAAAFTLTVNLPGVALTALDVDGTTTVTGTTSGAGLLDATAGNRNLTTANLDIATNGTFNARNSTVTLDGTTGTLFTRVGTFTIGGISFVNMASDASVTLTSGTITFDTLQLNPTITGDRTYTFGAGALTVNDAFTVNPTAAGAATLTANMGAGITALAAATTTIQGSGSAIGVLDTTGANHALSSGRVNIAAGGTFTANDSTVTLTATSGNPGAALFTRVGTFNQGNSTVVFNPNTANAKTLTAGTVTFHHLQLTPLITAARTYTFGAGAITVNGNFGINPDKAAAAAAALTVNMGAAIAVVTTGPGTGTTTITGTNFGRGLLDATLAGNFALSSGNLDVATNGTYVARASTVTLTGSGTLFTRTGTFTQGTSNVVLAPSASATLNSGTITFATLTTNMPGLTATLGNDITVNTTIDFDFDDNATADGILSTAANSVILPVAATTTGAAAGGHVVGNVQRAFTVGSPTFTYPMGDGVNYTPVLVAFSPVTTPGNLTVATTPAPVSDHPNTVAGTSPAEPNKSVNRYWTLKNSTLAGTADVTLNYLSGSPLDLDSGVAVGSFIVGRAGQGNCSGTGTARLCTTWFRPTVAGPGATQITANAIPISNAGGELDFVVGESRRVSREKEFIYTRETY